MGEQLINYYQKYVKRTWKIAFISACVCCFLAHIFKFTNTLPNSDAVLNDYIDQDMTISGRWFLQYACGISSYFDLPWFIGMLCAVYLGLITVVIVELFEIRNPIIIILTAGVLVCNPSATEILFFEYTADGYILGLFFSALAALYSCKTNKIKCSVISGLLVCISCAIYQSNISFGATLCVCFFLNKIFNGEMDFAQAIRWIIKHIVIYVMALVAYYVIWKMVMVTKNLEATEYLGISEVTKVSNLSLSVMIMGVKNSILIFRNFFLDWTLLDRSVTPYTIFNLLFLVAFIAILIVAAIKSKVVFSPIRLVFVLVSLAVVLPIISIWGLLSVNLVYVPRMLYAVCVVYIFAMILFDKWADKKTSTFLGVLVTVIIFNFALMANIAYQYLDDSYEKSYYLGARMMEEIEEYNEELFDEIAFVGSREDEVKISGSEPGDRIHLLAHQLYSDLMFHHSRIYPFMESVFNLEIPAASVEKRTELELHPDVQTMGIWPSENSIRIVDGILVIRISEKNVYT